MSASIIVVDDEPDVAELFRQRFRREARQGTYVMHFAASGEEALELLSGEIDPGDHHLPAARGRFGQLICGIDCRNASFEASALNECYQPPPVAIEQSYCPRDSGERFCSGVDFA